MGVKPRVSLIGGEMLQLADRDAQNLRRISEELQEGIRSYREDAYRKGLLYRYQANKRINKRLRPINFHPGDYVLLSEKGFESGHKDKCRPRWTGPDLEGNEKVRHASLLIPYAPSSFLPSADTRAVCILDHDRLEVEKILDIRKTSGGEFQFKVRWKGFGMDRDTWEAAFSLFDDIPAMIIGFLSRTSSEWKLEFEELKCCIKVYGMGNFEMIRKHLPSKSKQQIYNYIQRYIRKQSLEKFHGLKFNLEKIRKQNIASFGDKYRVLGLPLSKKVKIVRMMFTRWRYAKMHQENDLAVNRFEGVEAYDFLSVEGLKKVLSKLNELIRGGQVEWNGLPKWSRSVKELREVMIILIDKLLNRGKEIEVYREKARKIINTDFMGSEFVIA
eukprot:augustus_masked-scaffold_70-processed-gene-0.105-mRNA-1 protein AED:1.00 eAED:1.00 QI:0/0/0/0/1/1/3/0/386